MERDLFNKEFENIQKNENITVIYQSECYKETNTDIKIIELKIIQYNESTQFKKELPLRLEVDTKNNQVFITDRRNETMFDSVYSISKYFDIKPIYQV